MKISKKTFGILPNGKKARLYTLFAGELSFSLTDLGAAWTSLIVPSRLGRKDDVLLGASSFAGYSGAQSALAITVGRFANRIGGASFTLDGKTYHLEKNDGPNSLHGGRRGYDRVLWKSEAYKEKDGVYVRFEYNSPDGDSGFPGNLRAVVTYGITKSNEIIACYRAKSDKRTPVNLTNHAYFNLAGEGKGSVLDHELTLHSSSILDVDEGLIPTGKLLPVEGTAYDFRSPKPIGKDLETAVQAGAPGGYDHCYVIDGEIGKLRPCAEIFEGTSGRTMKILATQPGVQLYTGNFLKATPGKAGAVYNRHDGFCLETQHFPDSPNKPEFPDSIFGPARDYHEKAVFAFSW
ncbi:MAG: galactose mutarotase [Treponema sp.]|jgi:aldose 1-epimerase|nr:galactose mutarotase [Treponema sp.]